MHVARDRVAPNPERITAVSGGVLTGAGFIAHRGEQILSLMSEAFSDLDSNLKLDDLIEDEGITPHQRIYREVVTEAFPPEAIDAVAEGPDYHVLLAHPPTGPFADLSATAATLAYEAELHLVSGPHFNWAERMGITTSRVDARKAAREGMLVELICAAAVIPPLFALAKWEGKDVIDGGMSDQAPLPEPDEGTTLILLTRDYDRIPERDDRLYLAPSEETEADKIDFTDPEKIARTWEQGIKDAELFLNNLQKN